MKVEKGSKVKIHYEGMFENGDVFDSSKDSTPIEIVAGSGQVIKGFDEGILGMSIDEEKEISINPEEAYGEINAELTKEIPRSALPQDREPEEGMSLVMATPEGQQIPAKIVKVTPEQITIDLNHPLAGKKLLFKVKIIEIKNMDEEIEEDESQPSKTEEEVDEIMDEEIKEEISKDVKEKQGEEAETSKDVSNESELESEKNNEENKI